MLPSSLVGLLVFVVLLTPGFVVVLRRERQAPAPQSSVFRETVRLVAASVACLLAAGLLLGLLRVLLPGATVDVGALLRDPAGYAVVHHVRVAWWSLGGLAAAVLSALAGTDPRWAGVLRPAGADRPYGRWSGRRTATSGPCPHGPRSPVRRQPGRPGAGPRPGAAN